MVIGIVAVVLLIPCCGLVAGVGLLMFRASEAQSEAMRAQEQSVLEIEKTRQEMQKTKEEFEKTFEKTREEVEGIKFPDAPGSEIPSAPAFPDASEKK
ncbi:MAG: hypothetical protein ACR2FY_07990 [Pirellulaceae bacterium]